MRADAIGGRTWLLGAVAGWALCVWLLALFGLGGRVQRLAENPALLQPLPQVPKAQPERLGPLPQYAQIGQHPLFSEDRAPHPFFINPDDKDQGPAGFDFVLTSVLHTPDFEMAILQPTAGGDSQRVRLGDAPQTAPGWVLTEVDARSAVFNGPEGERKLELRVFDGEGGSPPTPMAGAGGTPRPGTPDASGMPTPPPIMRKPAPGAPKPASPSPPADMTNDAANAAAQSAEDADASAAQIDAIRKRIEERRAKLRQESPPPPPPPPGKQP